MITRRLWLQSKGVAEWPMEGWYLFGFIPLLVLDRGYRGRKRS